MQFLTIVAALLLAAVAARSAFVDVGNSCRFAPRFKADDLFSNAESRKKFMQEYLAKERVFARSLGVDKPTGMTYDGHRLDVITGLPIGKPHMFSAPSKESLHVALLTLSLDAKVNNQTDSWALQIFSAAEALVLLERKVTSYEKFHALFPGFGGFFPWVQYDGKGGVEPAWDWKNRVPSLDNGELFWAAYAASEVLRSFPNYHTLQKRWEKVWRNMTSTAVKVFYGGKGNIYAVVSLTNASLPVHMNRYVPTIPTQYLDDPYEGELFTVMVYLYSSLSAKEKHLLWINKRAKLQESSIGVKTSKGKLMNISTQRGWWFSAHEQWKYLMLPYFLSETNIRVARNAERARTWYAAHVTPSFGMWASVNGPVLKNYVNFPYDSACGVGPLAFQPVLHDDVVTPYSVFPLALHSSRHAIVWLHSMMSVGAGQNCFGTTESAFQNGTAVAPLTTWDSKITTVLALLGGIANITQKGLAREHVLYNFTTIVESEWARVFTLPLPGEALDYALPVAGAPKARDDFTSCNDTSGLCSYHYFPESL